MIKSMTGFGRAEYADDKRKFTVEIKSVNHRYLDMNIKMPKKLNFFEAAIRNELKNYIQRGKVDVFITLEEYAESNVGIKYNKDVAAEYVKYLKQMSEDFDCDYDIRVSTLSRFPEVFSMEDVEIDEDEIWAGLKEALTGAAEKFVDSRIKEGENLKKDLIEKLDDMLTHVQYVKDRAPEVIEEYKNGLMEKVKDLLADTKVDENRLLMEVTLFADKVCIDEEIVRLTSHIETTKKTLNDGGSIGRKLDFIAQEMNREANTMLSKANDLATSDHAIELKTEIEKVREQIQNIE
ncbi:MAG: YicC family protein [Lachnospiraceae bacterium]|nr:YicC family protein [Lachnospiraceae bacterium]